LRQRLINGFPVFSVWFDQEVDVLGGSRLPVKRDRIAAHNQVFNPSGVEDGQEFFEVVEHGTPAPSSDKPQG
jgi:hypothetical protein